MSAAAKSPAFFSSRDCESAAVTDRNDKASLAAAVSAEATPDENAALASVASLVGLICAVPPAESGGISSYSKAATAGYSAA